LSSTNKSERLHSIELILYSKSNGITRAELARKLGVSRATISRDIVDLSRNCAIYEDKNNHLYLKSLSALNSVRLTLPEIQILIIASRLLSRKIRFPYIPAGSALRKLGKVIKKYSPQYGKIIENTADVFNFDYSNEKNKKYGKLLDTLIKAVTEQKVIQLFHYSTRIGKETSYIFHIYHIEPHAEGNSMQVVGYAPEVKQIRTFKFERLTGIKILDEKYSIPSDFDADEYFKDCWSIWTSDKEPELVELVFSNSVKHRVQATRWHTSQSFEENTDGTISWKANIATPKEMLPWIRGWGRDVEVIRPKWLRDHVAEDVVETIKKYEKG